MITRGGIIAAGEGSRLQTKSKSLCKPMLTVKGKPLIEHTVQRFASAGIVDIVIIFNEDGADCARYVERTFPALKFEFIIKNTRSSFESFIEVGTRLGRGRHLISTVDSICFTKEFISFKKYSDTGFSKGIVLAVTSFVEDEKPLWVEVDQENKITKLGGPSGKFVTAGMYVIDDTLFATKLAPERFTSLRQFLKDIVDRGIFVYAYQFSKVIDVDRFEDRINAESFADKASDNLDTLF